MSELLSLLWMLAGFIAASSVILILAFILYSIIKAIIFGGNINKNKEDHHE